MKEIEMYAKIQELKELGMSQNAVAAQLGMIHAKSSLAPEGKPVAFELDKDNGFHYLGEYDGDANELLSGSGGKKKGKLAEQLLLHELREGAKSQKEILAKAEECGISKRTMST